MYFSEDSEIVKDYLLLLELDEIKVEEIPPNLGLREVVKKAYEKHQVNRMVN